MRESKLPSAAKQVKLIPSGIRKNPGRFEPQTSCRVRAPLGEWIGPMALPLVVLGLKDQLVQGRILGSDRWNAQGPEGAGELACTWAQAFVLVAKADDRRCTIVVWERSQE